jgi:hypothetical protein
VPAVTLGVSTNFALANCLASRSLRNVSVALMSVRLPRGRSKETYHVPWDLLAMEPSRGSGAALADPDRLLADIARHLGALVFAVWMTERPNRLAILRTASGFLPILLAMVSRSDVFASVIS